MTTTINASTTLGLQQTADTSGILQLQTANTAALTIDASQNVGIGTASPNFSGFGSNTGGVQVTNATNAAFKLSGNAGGDFYFVSGSGQHWLYATGAVPMSFSTNGTERARIDSSGNLLVGKTALNDAVAGAQIAGSSATYPGRICATVANSTNATEGIVVYSSTAAAYRFYVSMDGKVNATNTTIAAISDQRLKENIRDLDDGLSSIMALQPRKFDWKEGKGADIKNVRGFIAQEFETVFPDLIDTWKDPAPEGEEPYKSVRADLIPTLVKAIQEQQALITTLTERITALEAK